MGLHMVNTSINTAEPIPQDITFNDQETIVEMVVEQFLGFGNVMEETTNDDTEDCSLNNSSKTGFVTLFFIERNAHEPRFGIIKQGYPYFADCLTQGHLQYNTPPPKI